VGVRGPNAAFVFGSYSLLEKFANGILLYFIMVFYKIFLIKNIFLEYSRCEQ